MKLKKDDFYSLDQARREAITKPVEDRFLKGMVATSDTATRDPAVHVAAWKALLTEFQKRTPPQHIFFGTWPECVAEARRLQTAARRAVNPDAPAVVRLDKTAINAPSDFAFVAAMFQGEIDVFGDDDADLAHQAGVLAALVETCGPALLYNECLLIAPKPDRTCPSDDYAGDLWDAGDGGKWVEGDPETLLIELIAAERVRYPTAAAKEAAQKELRELAMAWAVKDIPRPHVFDPAPVPKFKTRDELAKWLDVRRFNHEGQRGSWNGVRIYVAYAETCAEKVERLSTEGATPKKLARAQAEARTAARYAQSKCRYALYTEALIAEMEAKLEAWA